MDEDVLPELQEAVHDVEGALQELEVSTGYDGEQIVEHLLNVVEETAEILERVEQVLPEAPLSSPWIDFTAGLEAGFQQPPRDVAELDRIGQENLAQGRALLDDLFA